MNKYPNIVVLITDDQGPWAVPWKMPELHMPNLGNLAEEPGSYRFDQFYCASPVCSPARASILTGRMPSAHGIHDWLTGTRHPEAKPDKYIEDLPLLTSVFAGHGYTCAMTGKWHVGESYPPAPGFQYWYAHRFGGGSYYEAPIWDTAGTAINESEYFTNAIGNHAIEFLENHPDNQPFFLWAATTAPHDPWLDGNHPSQLLDLYKDTDFPSVPRLPAHPWTADRRADFEYAFANPQPALQGYCAALSGVDEILGKIRQTLEKRNWTDNTIILYMSDNGFSCGHHGVWGKGNGTYPLNFWENSVKVPAVLHIPPALALQQGWENPGGILNTPFSAVDIYPTLCELAKLSPPVDPLRAGQSFASLITNSSNPHNPKQPVLIFDEYGGGRMIRQDNWKLVIRFHGPAELYNLATDPQETNNLLEISDSTYKDKANELKQVLENWFNKHQTSQHYAFDRPVQGFGQVHPTWRAQNENAYVANPNKNKIFSSKNNQESKLPLLDSLSEDI